MEERGDIAELEKKIFTKYPNISQFLKAAGWPPNTWLKYKKYKQRPSEKRLRIMATLLDGSDMTWFLYSKFFR